MNFLIKTKMSFAILVSLFYLSTPTGVLGNTAQIQQDIALMKASLENANTKLAEAMNQMMTLQQEFNAMRGTVDGSGYFQQEQTRALREYDQRITALEDKITTLMTLLKEIKESGGAPKIGSMDDAQGREFGRLLDFINTEDYAKALPGFQAFLQKYPKSPVADNAQYWIAECYYGLNDYKKAISEYQVLIQKYPRSSKIKSAIFKQGLSFFGLKMYPEARPFFEKIIAEYPASTEASRANIKIKEIDKLMAQAPVTLSPTTNPSSPGSSQPTPNTPSVPPGAPPLHSPGGTIRMPVEQTQPVRQAVPTTHSIYD